MKFEGQLSGMEKYECVRLFWFMNLLVWFERWHVGCVEGKLCVMIVVVLF